MQHGLVDEHFKTYEEQKRQRNGSMNGLPKNGSTFFLPWNPLIANRWGKVVPNDGKYFVRNKNYYFLKMNVYFFQNNCRKLMRSPNHWFINKNYWEKRLKTRYTALQLVGQPLPTGSIAAAPSILFKCYGFVRHLGRIFLSPFMLHVSLFPAPRRPIRKPMLIDQT